MGQADLRATRMNDLNRFLKNCIHRGCVLHGSSVLCEVLQPHPGYCITGLKENLEVAVYATISPSIAIFNAIKPPKCRYTRYELIEGNPYFEADEEIIKSLGEGYVYVLDRSKFKKCQIEEGQFTSLEEVRPIYAVKVTKDDFGYPIEAINAVVI